MYRSVSGKALYFAAVFVFLFLLTTYRSAGTATHRTAPYYCRYTEQLPSSRKAQKKVSSFPHKETIAVRQPHFDRVCRFLLVARSDSYLPGPMGSHEPYGMKPSLLCLIGQSLPPRVPLDSSVATFRVPFGPSAASPRIAP